MTSSTLVGRFPGVDFDPYSHRWGVGAGLAGEVRFSRLAAVGVNATFVRKGAKARPLTGFPEMRLDYLEFPIVVRLQIPVSQRFRWFVDGGGAASIEIFCSAADAGCENMRTEKTDFSWMAGSGLRLFVGGIWLTATARYAGGLKNLAAGFRPAEMRSRSTLFSFGLLRVFGSH